MKENKKTLEKILADYLDCPYRIFKPMKDDSALMEAYREAAERGKTEGFVPMFICCENMEFLLEKFLCNTSKTSPVNEEYHFDMEAVRAFREKMCQSELPEGKSRLKEWLEEMGVEEYYNEDDENDNEDDENEEYDDEDKDYEDEDYSSDYEDDYDDEDDYEDDNDYDDDDENYDEDDEDYEEWEKECLRLMEEEEDEDMDDTTLLSYRSHDGVYCTATVFLAEIPVTNPWEVFAWLPFGGWNECPDTEDLMAISKYWFETYGAVPAAIDHDVLEYMVPQPVKEDDSKTLAREMAAFCPDIIMYGEEDVELLADDLTESTEWYFWWD